MNSEFAILITHHDRHISEEDVADAILGIIEKSDSRAGRVKVGHVGLGYPVTAHIEMQPIRVVKRDG